jgi:hypothetical protein
VSKLFCMALNNCTKFDVLCSTWGSNSLWRADWHYRRKRWVVNYFLNRLQSWPKEEFRTTHVKSSQLVNKMCSQQACSKLGNKL